MYACVIIKDEVVAPDTVMDSKAYNPIRRLSGRGQVLEIYAGVRFVGL